MVENTITMMIFYHFISVSIWYRFLFQLSISLSVYKLYIALAMSLYAGSIILLGTEIQDWF
jgi:hypothetical protein